jgi:cyanate permease
MAFSIAFSVIYNAILMTHLEEMLIAYGYNDGDVSTYGFISNLCGIVGGIITAKIIRNTGQYRNLALILIICMSFTAVSF